MALVMTKMAEMDMVSMKLIDNKTMNQVIHLPTLQAREVRQEIPEAPEDLKHNTIVSLLPLTVGTARH